MNNKIDGFILSVSDYKENDSLLQVLTKNHKIITLVAKGSKKLNSHHHYLPFCVYEFMFDYLEHKTIFTIKSAKLLNSYFKEDYKMMELKGVISELLIKNKELLDDSAYENVIFINEKLNDDNVYLLMSLFVSWLIKKSGVMPCVDGCVVCAEKKVIGLSTIKGGFVCKNHALEMDVKDIERLKKFRLIIKADFKNYNDICEVSYDFEDFETLVNFYIDNTGLKLNSFRLLKSV